MLAHSVAQIICGKQKKIMNLVCLFACGSVKRMVVDRRERGRRGRERRNEAVKIRRFNGDQTDVNVYVRREIINTTLITEMREWSVGA